MAANIIRTVHGKTIHDVLNTPGLPKALKDGFNTAKGDGLEYGGLVYETNGVLSFKGPKKGPADGASFPLEVYVKSEGPKGANDNIVGVWHIHSKPDSARTCKPSDEDVDNAKSVWKNVFYFVITGTKELKGGKPFPGAERFADVTANIADADYKVWYVL